MTFNDIKEYLENKGLSFDDNWCEFRYGNVVFCDCKHDFGKNAKERFYALDFTRLTIGHGENTKLLTEVLWEVMPELRYTFKEITPEFLDKKYKEFIERLDWLNNYSKKEKIIQKENELRRDF